MKISKKNNPFLSHVPRIIQPQNYVPRQKMVSCSVFTHTETHSQSDYWIFSFNLSSRIGQISSISYRFVEKKLVRKLHTRWSQSSPCCFGKCVCIGLADRLSPHGAFIYYGASFRLGIGGQAVLASAGIAMRVTMS